MRKMYDMGDAHKVFALTPEQCRELFDFLDKNLDNLIGPMMETIEVLGLPDKQEKPFKAQIKEHLYKKWDWFYKALFLMRDKSLLTGHCPECSHDDQCPDCAYYSIKNF